MKSISLWGQRHKWSARVLIVLLHIVLIILALLIGDGLLANSIEVNAWLAYLCTAVYLGIFVLYPFRKERKRVRNFYRWQKTCDWVMVTASFLLLISAANLRHSADSPFHFTAARAITPAPIHPPKSIKVEKKEKGLALVKSVKKKLSRTLHQFRAYFKSRSLGGQILLMTLAVVLGAGALFLVAALSCEIACAGSGAAALAVALLGTAAVVFLFVRAMRGIWRKPTTEPTEKPA